MPWPQWWAGPQRAWRGGWVERAKRPRPDSWHPCVERHQPPSASAAAIAELEDHAALAAFGGAPPEDIRGHLASQPGCIRGRLFGRAQAAAYAQQAGQHAEQAAGAAAHATEAAGEARDAAVSAQRAVGVQALTIAVSARIDAEAATRREQVALQAYHATQSGQQQRTLSARGEHDAAAQIFRSDVLSGPVRTLWEHSLATAAAGIGSVSVDSALTMPTSHPVLMMVYVDAPIADFTDARVAAFCKKLAGALMNADLKEIRPDQIRVKRKPMAGAAGPDQKRLWRAAVKAGRCYVKVHVSDEYMPSYSSSSGDSSSTSGASLDEDDEDVLEDEEDRQLKEAVKIAVATKIFPGPRVTADTVEPQIIPIPGPIHASSLWLVVQMPAPLALVLLDCAKRRSQQLLDEHVRCMRLVDVGGVLRDQREFVAQLDDRPDIQQCLATLERNESALLDGHLTETKADQRAESASHKWWLQPDEFEGGPTGADSQDGPMIQGLRDGNAEVDIALQKLSLDKAEVEITNGALADNQALLLAQELATNTTVTRLDLSGNDFAEETGVAIAKALGKNTALQSLDLSGNHKLGEATLGELTRALKTNKDSRLQTLKFGNGLPEQMKALLKRSSSEAIIFPADAKVQETASISIQLDTSGSKQRASAEIFMESSADGGEHRPAFKVHSLEIDGDDAPGGEMRTPDLRERTPSLGSNSIRRTGDFCCLSAKFLAKYSLRWRAVCCVPALCILCFQLAGIWQKAPMEPYLRREVTLAATGNWSLMFLASFPLLASLLLWHGMLHAKSVAHEAFHNDDGLITEKELQNAIILAKNMSGLIFHAIVGTCMLLVWIASNFGINAKTYTSPRHYIQIFRTSLGCIVFMIVFTFSLRNLAIAVLRRENPVGARTRDATVRYIDGTFSPRIAVVVGLQTVAFVHVIFFAHNTRWHTFSIKGSISDEWGGLPEVDECLRLNSTYMARYCTSTIRDLDERAFMQLSQEGYRQYITAGTLRCDDGGFGVYVSKYDACESMREFAVLLGQRAVTFTCMGLLLVMAVGLREIVAGLDDRLQWSAFFVPRLDLPNQCSCLLKCIVTLSSAGMLLIPMLFIEATKTSAPMQFLPLRTDTGPIPLVWTSYGLWFVIGILGVIEFAYRKYQGPSSAALLSDEQKERLLEAVREKQVLATQKLPSVSAVLPAKDCRRSASGRSFSLRRPSRCSPSSPSVRAEASNPLERAGSRKFSEGSLFKHKMLNGQPAAAALGMAHLLHLTPQELNLKVYGPHPNGSSDREVRAIEDEIEKHDREVQAIKNEIEKHDNEDLKECLRYVLYEEAGSSAKLFSNSPYPRDHDERGLHKDRRRTDGKGKRISDFVEDMNAKTAHLTKAHVLALRLYTTSAYTCFNDPLRDFDRSTGRTRDPHPLAATVEILNQAIRQLRAVGAYHKDAMKEKTLWRGMKDLEPDDSFLKYGGTEMSPMSTSGDLTVAVNYSESKSALLFKFVTPSFMLRGVDLSFLSVFPAESEFLYPPLTFLMPTGREQTIKEGGYKIKVIEVTPQL